MLLNIQQSRHLPLHFFVASQYTKNRFMEMNNSITHAILMIEGFFTGFRATAFAISIAFLPHYSNCGFAGYLYFSSSNIFR